MTISEIKKHVPFNVIVPENVQDDWTLEIKTYPCGTKTDFTSFSLHYMDRNDEKMMVSVTQKKSIAKQTKEYILNAKTISINGHLGRILNGVMTVKLTVKEKLLLEDYYNGRKKELILKYIVQGYQ